MSILPMDDQIQGLLGEAYGQQQVNPWATALTSLGTGLLQSNAQGMGWGAGLGMGAENFANDLSKQQQQQQLAKRQKLADLLDLYKIKTTQGQFDQEQKVREGTLDLAKLELASKMQPKYSLMPSSASATPVPQAGTAGATKGGEPLSVRNNNPGNLRGSDGQFRTFTSPQEGMSAMRSDLYAKVTGRSQAMKSRLGEGYAPTIENIIGVYAPASENNTSDYIAKVSKATGIAPDRSLNEQEIDTLMGAMIPVEGGNSAAQYFNQAKVGQELASQAPVSQRQLQVLDVAPGGVETAGVAQNATAQPQFIRDANGMYVTEGMQPGMAATGTKDANGNLVITGRAAIPYVGDRPTDFEGEQKLRKEFDDITSKFRERRSALDQIEGAFKDTSGSSDVAGVFSFMKMLDPTSTINNGEYANAKNTGGVPDRIRNIYNQALKGTFLTAEQRFEFNRTAFNLVNASKKGYTEQVNRFTGIANKSKMNVENIIPQIDLNIKPPERPKTGADAKPETKRVTLSQFLGG